MIAHARQNTITSWAPGDVGKSSMNWTMFGDSTSTVAVRSAQGGGFAFATDNTDNDCSGLYYGPMRPVSVGTVNTTFGFTAVVTGTEGSTSAANWIIGFCDVIDNTVIGDTGGLGTIDAIGFRKVESSMFFRTLACNAGVETSGTGLTATAYASATSYLLEFNANVTTLGIEAEWFVNGTRIGVLGRGSANAPAAVASWANMHLVICIGNGAGAIETLTFAKFVPYTNVM